MGQDKKDRLSQSRRAAVRDLSVVGFQGTADDELRACLLLALHPDAPL
jgi:hypothetical protein